jgi:choline kinase
VEEYFDSATLTAEDIRDSVISRWIGARMAEFHSVDVSVVSPPSDLSDSGTFEASVKKCVSSWMKSAREVFAIPTMPRGAAQELDLARFEKEWNIYLKWVSKVEDKTSGSAIVFGHNDTQYGNLLQLTNSVETDEHRQVNTPSSLALCLL